MFRKSESLASSDVPADGLVDIIRREGEPDLAASRREWPAHTWGWMVCVWLLGVGMGAWMW